MLNTYREYAERLEVTQALTVLATSVLILLISVLTLLIVGILLYLLIIALKLEVNKSIYFLKLFFLLVIGEWL
jgi:hypothetical protein